jgi:hypothetical protein
MALSEGVEVRTITEPSQSGQNAGNSTSLFPPKPLIVMAGSTGLEPATSGLTVQCANQAAPRARAKTPLGYTTPFQGATSQMGSVVPKSCPRAASSCTLSQAAPASVTITPLGSGVVALTVGPARRPAHRVLCLSTAPASAKFRPTLWHRQPQPRRDELRLPSIPTRVGNMLG